MAEFDDFFSDWLNARENARRAISDIEHEGATKARAEADYYAAKSCAYTRLLAQGNATSAANLVKGVEEVSKALYLFRLAESKYKAAQQASQLFNQEEAHTYDQYKRVMAGDSERF